MNTSPKNPQMVTRRALLRGIGATLTLPWFESLSGKCWGATGPQPAEPPLRIAFLYVPNGMHMPDWTPNKTGSAFELTPILKPLEAFRDQMTVLSGLTLDGARAHGDGGGDHARAVASFLTGVHPRKTDGANIKNGISIDQLIAGAVGSQSRFPSLELGIEGSSHSGNCDSGYSCAYTSNLSWRTEKTPVPKEINPQAVFDRLVGGDDSALGPTAKRRRLYRASVLDMLQEDAGDLHRQLGKRDQQKLDEYLYAVREIERRLNNTEKIQLSPEQLSALERPAGIPEEYEQHLKLMFDMLHLSLLSDSTRVATLMFANAASNRAYRELGISGGHHELSHHGGNADKQAAISKINQYHTQLLSHFLERMQNTEESGGSLLDHSLIVYGSGIADGNSHNHDDLPIVLFGNAKGTVRTGRHVRYPAETPLTNLYVSMAQRMGVQIDQFSDSTGVLEELE